MYVTLNVASPIGFTLIVNINRQLQIYTFTINMHF